MSGDAEFRYPVTDAPATPGPTPWQTVGPFFHFALPYDGGDDVVGPDRPGAIRLGGRVLDGDGNPVPDSLVETWQADESGRFAAAPGIFGAVVGGGFRGFGRVATDADGGYRLRTVKPGPVPTVDGLAQAPHIAMSVFARGMLRRLVTRVYFEGEQNDRDPLLGTLGSRGSTLVAARTDDGYLFDVHMQGDRETVFLDVVTG